MLNLKRTSAIIMSLSILASIIPTASQAADTIGAKWKFDFGAEGQKAAEGYYSVTPLTEYNTNEADGFQFGLYGQNVNDYKLGNYEDGVTMKKGQYYAYTSAGTEDTVDSDKIGIGELPQGQIDGLYPIRFTMDAENNSFYKIKVNVTTLDDSTNATKVNVYSERRHPIVTNQTIEAGAVQTVTFTASPQNVLIKDRANGGTITYKDEKLNVEVVGNNAAISSIEVEKVEPATTIWCYDDSTGCDYPMTLPFFPLQNYGGTAQFLSKYLGEDIVLENQGDGGIAANALTYFNLCKNNIKAGDYIYLQYGHNHKKDGPAGYVQYLNKYYSWAHEKGAKMIFVGPIDRHNESQYNSSTNTWSSTLGGFSKVAKYYTELLICGGPELAEQLAQKAKSQGLTSDVYAWADSEIAKGITDKGVTDAAFIDLNAPTLSWLSEICDEVKTIKGSDTYSKRYTDYYFQGRKGDNAVDGTHENDLGADATASFFFDGIQALADKSSRTEIEEVQYQVLKPLLENKRNADPDRVDEDIIKAGNAPNSAYPDVYQSSDISKLPISIKSIEWNENNTISQIKIAKQEAILNMSQYGKLELIIKDKDGAPKGTITSTQVDNTWSDGSTTIFTPTDETNLLLGDINTVYDKEAGDVFTAIVYAALDDAEHGLIFDETSGKRVEYSNYYEETEVLDALIPNEDGEQTEDFNYYGVKYDGTADINSKNGWTINGSATKKTSLHSETIDGTTRYYTEAGVGNASTSYAMSKKLSETVKGGSGRISMSVDLRANGDNTPGNIKLGLGNEITTWPSKTLYMIDIDRNGNVYACGNTEEAVAVLSNTDWITVDALLDMDLGTVTVSCGDKAATALVPELTTTSTDALATYSTFHVGLHEGKEGSSQISNLKVLKLTPSENLPNYIVTAKPVDNAYGTVTCDTQSAKINSVVTVTAAPTITGMRFVNWKDADGNIVSESSEYSFRLRDNTDLTAYFGYDAIVNAVDDKGNILKTLAETQGVPGEEYSVGALEKVIEKDGVYYEMTVNTEDTKPYSRTFTMGADGNETRTITYNKNENIVYFAEAENTSASGNNYASADNGDIYSGGKAKQGKKTDAYMTFDNIVIPSDGLYKITYPCDNTSDKARTVEVFLDNKSVSDDSLAIAKNTTNKNTSTVQSFTAELTKGTHFIVLNTSYSLTPYIDYLLVEKMPDPVKGSIIKDGEYSYEFNDASLTTIGWSDDVADISIKLTGNDKTTSDGIYLISNIGEKSNPIESNTGYILIQPKVSGKLKIEAICDRSANSASRLYYIDIADKKLSDADTFLTGLTKSSTIFIDSDKGASSPVTISKEIDVAAGHIYAFAHYNTMGMTVKSVILTSEDITAPELSKEEQPNISIDYVNEQLTGFKANEKYTINGIEITPEDTSVAIKNEYFGTTLELVKCGNGVTTSNSTTQMLDIPEHPLFSNELTPINASDEKAKDGSIIGVDNTMEYKLLSSTEWTSCESTKITELIPGTYQIRIKAIAGTSFASSVQTVVVGISSEVTVVFLNYNDEELWRTTVTKGTAIAYGGEMPIKAADEMYTYEFSGWDSEIIPANENKTYKAQFKSIPRAYNIIYNKNGGVIENESNYISYTYGVGLTLPIPIRDGYTFDGWYENENLSGNKTAAISSDTSGDKTYYANWVENTIPDEPIYLEVLGTFADKLAIEKIIDKDSVKLVISSKDGNALPELMMYTAIYNNDKSLKDIKTIPGTSDNGNITIVLKQPQTTATESYKLLLWDNNQAPVIHPITDEASFFQN